MSVVIVIPARHASTRYPGKPLVELRGASGQGLSLIRRSWEAARAAQGIDRVIVATDDERIRDHALGFGAEVAMTSTAALAGGPVVVVEEGQPEVVAESPRSGWIVPVVVGLVVLCAIACGNDDEQRG